MISSIISKNKINTNASIQDYCRKSTQLSIAKLTEKYNSERNKIKIKSGVDCNNNIEINIKNILLFLSISSLSFYLYKRLH